MWHPLITARKRCEPPSSAGGEAKKGAPLAKKKLDTILLICPSCQSVAVAGVDRHGKSVAFRVHPVPARWALAIVTNVGRDAVDASLREDEPCGRRTAKSCGPDAPLLAFKSLRVFCEATVSTSPVTGESTKKTVEPSRREGRIASAEPVCSCAFSWMHILHTRPRVQRAPGPSLPLS